MSNIPNRFTPIREIGGGGFGIVWEVEDVALDEHVALKMPRLTLNREERARFSREVRLQSLLEHPNILPIFEYDLDSTPPWFTAPLAHGNLADALPAMSEEDAIEAFMQVLQGMDHAHRNHVLHRDLKPQNILIFGSSVPRQAAVSDFGLGRAYTRSSSFQTREGAGAGTPGYMAPEQWSHLKDADHRADIYGLGRILNSILEVVTPPLSQLRRRLEYCIRTASAENPEHRYQSVSEFEADIRLVIDRPRAFQRPIDVAYELLHELTESGDFSAKRTRPLAHLLMENASDQRLLPRVLPRLSIRLLEALLKLHVAAMTSVIQAYSSILEGPVTVDVAFNAMRFAEDVLSVSADQNQRAISLIMVLKLVVRFDVAESRFLASRCIVNEDDPQVVQMLMHYLRENPSTADWCRDALPVNSLAPVLRDTIIGSR